MPSHEEAAAERHSRGYNCAQAVACSFADELGMDEASLFRAAEGLGLGMGGMQATCGAVAGACMVAGLLNSTGDLDHPNSKASTYRLSRQIVERFGEANGSTTCRELKGVGTGTVLAPCTKCVSDAVRIAEDVLREARMRQA
nr:C-GCAxxG-C-C family protein [uncultured Olsenella sp.]